MFFVFSSFLLFSIPSRINHPVNFLSVVVCVRHVTSQIIDKALIIRIAMQPVIILRRYEN